MNWVNLHQDWGVPAVNLFLARQMLDDLPLLDFLEVMTADETRLARIEQWVAEIFAGRYPGVQVSGLHWMPHLDALVLTVLHPQFPRTPAYATLPRWDIVVHDAETGRPWFTIEEREI